jgi:exosome complex RNA-binding protein Rrp42 (RNase PH superfamily)
MFEPPLLNAFVRPAFEEEGVRIDGRGHDRFRKINIEVHDLGQVEVSLGRTKVFCSVSGEIVKPNPGKILLLRRL